MVVVTDSRFLVRLFLTIVVIEVKGAKLCGADLHS
jgi:hypothetical protein